MEAEKCKVEGAQLVRAILLGGFSLQVPDAAQVIPWQGADPANVPAQVSLPLLIVPPVPSHGNPLLPESMNRLIHPPGQSPQDPITLRGPPTFNTAILGAASTVWEETFKP